MNRRNFLGSLAAGTAALVVPAITEASKPVVEYARNTTGIDMPHVQPANGQRMIVGVAMRDVRAGDFVELVTSGPVEIRTMT